MPATSFRDRVKKTKPFEPLWKGPCADGPNGGITQSMLNDFLVCPERFRVKYVLGLQPADDFNHRIEYGSMWHVCEEALAGGKPWKAPLREYCKKLCRRYPLRQQDIIHWMRVCEVQFPIYVEYWSKYPEARRVTHLLQEQAFDVPYKLPSGRIVRLRGKWDGVDLL